MGSRRSEREKERGAWVGGTYAGVRQGWEALQDSSGTVVSN